MYWFTMPVDIRFRDTDGLGHVNNAVYLSYFESVRVKYGLELVDGKELQDIHFILGEATVRYRKPIFFGDQIIAAVRVSRLGSKSFTMIYELRRGDDVITTGSTELVWYDYENDRSIGIPDAFKQRVHALQGEDVA